MNTNERNLKLLEKKDYETLVKENDNLVYCIINTKFRFVPIGSDLYQDILQEGRLGLFKAALNFDPSKKFCFSTFAARCIYNQIGMYFRINNRHLHILSLDDYKTLKVNMGFSGNKDEDINLYDVIEDRKASFKLIFSFKSEEFSTTLNEALRLLSDDQRKSFILYYFDNIKQEEIANILCCSQAIVSRRIASAKKKIQRYLLKHGMDMYYFED